VTKSRGRDGTKALKPTGGSTTNSNQGRKTRAKKLWSPYFKTRDGGRGNAGKKRTSKKYQENRLRLRTYSLTLYEAEGRKGGKEKTDEEA